jgi:bacteriorhodopsin
LLENITGDVPNPDELYLWIGCGFQAFGVLMCAVLGSRMRAEDRSHMAKALFVNLIAACSYFAMASGQLDFHVGTSHDAQMPRYIDWLVTTPLLLLSLLVVALPGVHHFARQRERTALIGTVLGTQAFLILTGIFASLSATPSIKWTWFAISSVAQLVLYWLLFVKVRQEADAHGGENVAVYKRMAVFLTAWWFLYPVAWALGPQGFDLWGESGDALVFTVLDIVAKVVFNGVLLTTILRLSRRVTPVTGIGTIELLAGTDPVEDALDRHAGRQHVQPAPSGGVLVGAGTGNGTGRTGDR